MIADDYVKAFANSGFDAAQINEYAQHLADVEAKLHLKPKKVLINGIPAFPEWLSATFEVDNSVLGQTVGALLAHPKLDPNIIINGKPAVQFKDVTISLGR